MKQKTYFDIEMYPPFEGFPKEGVTFLRKLKKNNNREWFGNHKPEFEEYVKLPMQSFIGAMKQPMFTLAPEILVDPKKSMFRIYRDTRFSKNKSPYKTHVSAIFHPKGHWEQSAGFYFHIEPGEVFLGGGIYMPDGNQLKSIRRAITDRSEEFLSIVGSKSFKKRFGELKGEKLQRSPLGYSPDHPMIEWLKFKQFFGSVSWDEKECYSPKLIDKVIEAYEDLLPLIRFLNNALVK
jgi:uncharacterized protein (TIGR02453 family)